MIKEKLRNGSYQPQPVKAVDIPKPDGGVRTLGIPTVIDRLIQQSISQVQSNILLDRFDKELSKRGHSHVRYADDCNIYLRSKSIRLRVP